MDLKFFLTLNNKLISVNDLYKAKIGYKYNHPYPILYKNPKAVKLAEEMREQMRALTLTDEQKGWLYNTKQFTLYLSPIFKVGEASRDASNIIKLAEDELVKYIKYDLGIDKYDDALHKKVVVEKAVFPGSKHEFLGVCLSDYTNSVRFDEIERPEKIWINYDKEIEFASIPKRKKKGVVYLEQTEKEDANTLVYLIKSKNDISSTNLMKLIRDADAVCMTRRYKFLYIAILDKNIEGANEFVNFIKEYSQEYSGIKAEFIDKNNIITRLENYV